MINVKLKLNFLLMTFFVLIIQFFGWWRQIDDQPNVVNKYYIWTGKIDFCAFKLVKLIIKMMKLKVLLMKYTGIFNLVGKLYELMKYYI